MKSLRPLRSMDRYLVWAIIGLSIFGLIVLLSASGPTAFQGFSDPIYYVRRQILLGLIPGGLLFYGISRFDVRKLKAFAFPALIVTLLLLLSVFIPGLGHRVGGSVSWLNFGFIRVQPSEFAKVSFIIYAAGWLASRGQKEGRTLEGAIPFFLSIAAVMFLLAIQPDTGSMSVLVMTVMAMYFAAGAPIVWFGTLFAALAAAIAILVKVTPYRAARFMTFLHPELDPQGVGYHINQAFLAIGSGGIFGLGYGQSRQKFLYLPEAQDDSIFAIMAEELGFIMCVVFLVALSYLVWRCITIARKAPDAFQMYLCIGVGAWIAIQSIVNIASMTGLMPMTGVTLPLVSYGNSSTVALFIGLGLVASVSRSRHGSNE